MATIVQGGTCLVPGQEHVATYNGYDKAARKIMGNDVHVCDNCGRQFAGRNLRIRVTDGNTATPAPVKRSWIKRVMGRH